MFGCQRKRESPTVPNAWCEFRAEEDQMMTSADGSIVRDNRKSSARRRQQLRDWRKANYILSLSLGKEVVPGDLSANASANAAHVTLQALWRDSVCARNIISNMLSNYITNKVPMFHMLLLVMSYLQFTVHLGGETFLPHVGKIIMSTWVFLCSQQEHWNRFFQELVGGLSENKSPVPLWRNAFSHTFTGFRACQIALLHIKENSAGDSCGCPECFVHFSILPLKRAIR